MATEVPRELLLYGDGETLRWNGRPIRVLPVNGVLWYALPDICDALDLHREAAAMVNHLGFPACAKMVAGEDPKDEGRGKPRDVVILSPVGVWALTCLTDPVRGQNLAAWAKRSAEDRKPDLPEDDRALTLRLAPDGSLPPYPCRFSGWKRAWITLRESPEYRLGPKGWRQGFSSAPVAQAA